MVKDGMGFTPGATLCSGIQVFVQDLKGIDIHLASEKHELSVFWMIFQIQIWPIFVECFLIFLKNDWDETMGFHISRRSQGKDPLNARFANPIGHCDSQSWKHSGIGRHWGKARVLRFFSWFCSFCQFFKSDFVIPSHTLTLTIILIWHFFKKGLVKSESYSFPDRSKVSHGVAVVEVRSGVWSQSASRVRKV